MEWSILVLRNLLHLAIKLGSGSLIHTAGICQSALADGLKDAEHTCGIYIGSKLRRVEAYLYVALSSQVVVSQARTVGFTLFITWMILIESPRSA